MTNGTPLLSADEFLAINCWKNQSTHVEINSDLCNNKPLNVVIESLQNALKKLSDQKIKITFRGERNNDLNFTTGKDIVRKGFTATTDSIRSAGISLANQTGKNRTIECIIGKNSANIKSLSEDINGSHNIYPTGSRFTTIFKYQSPSINTTSPKETKEAIELHNAFSSHYKNVHDTLGKTIVEEMRRNNEGQPNHIDILIAMKQRKYQEESMDILDVLNNGVTFVVQEEAGLPATAGRQGYVEALDLATHQHPPLRPNDQNDTGTPRVATQSAPRDFMPGVGPLEGSSAPAAGISVEDLFKPRKA